ncbi:MAG: glycoside hydrolase family 97 catalytic domain-containing protein, partial [Ignavibacteriales bacterium]|nr:glycoside hydrolase family 97 catalytic domain-containing protein [Ignavibacteriales bacterium]
EAIFPKYPKKVEQINDRNVKVTKRECYIAKTNGTRSFPWRIFAISKEDKDLLTNQLVYILASENKLEDVSWIKTGKVAWDWWNANNLFDVDFKPGLNNKTYKFYIDFASKYGIEYIILDEGWYNLGNLFDVNPEINLEELIKYGKEKKVGIILWVVWKTLDDQLNEVLDWFEKLGVKGIKVDFMQRDDQLMVNYYWKICKEAAKRKLLVDFHGAYKPTGLRRTFPNLVSREGVMGLEHLKWSDKITPEHNLIIPFIRMVAGHMDYTPGAMLNAHKENFQVSFSSPMSIGTRCHQLAMYVIYESQLQMLADSPSNYLNEKECTEFVSKVPVVWDETIVLDAKLGEYILMAKRNGKEWFVGGMTNSTSRTLELDFSFLDEGDYQIEIFQDGLNIEKNASDYQKIVKQISKNDKMNISMYIGGGFAGKIYPSKK